jgi:hypothetical protein
MSLLRSSSSNSFPVRAERRLHRGVSAAPDGTVEGVVGEVRQTLSVSPTAQALLCELAVSGASGEFIGLYLNVLDALTLDDLRVLNHALQWRQWKPEGGLSQALFWGWRRHVERLQAQRIKTAQAECTEPAQCDQTTTKVDQ